MKADIGWEALPSIWSRAGVSPDNRTKAVPTTHLINAANSRKPDSGRLVFVQISQVTHLDTLHRSSVRRCPIDSGVAGLLRSSSCPSIPLSRYANCSTPFIAWIQDESWPL